jgi:hypothetical protein
LPSPQPWPTEIQYLRVTALGHKNVGRLDVAMNDTLRVRGVQAVSNFNSQRYCRFVLQRFAGNQMFERNEVEATKRPSSVPSAL